MHGFFCEFLMRVFFFVSLLVTFNFFPQSNKFFTMLPLYMACKMWKIPALIEEISSWRLVEKFRISAFSMYCSLYNWIREHDITKPKKYIYLLRILKKRERKQAQKDMKEMEWHKMDYLIFSAMSMRKHHLFCTSSHHNVPYENQQELNKGSEPWNEFPC